MSGSFNRRRFLRAAAGACFFLAGASAAAQQDDQQGYEDGLMPTYRAGIPPVDGPPDTSPRAIDNHVVIALDMSGSISREEAREMQRAWKDALLEKFSNPSEKGLVYALTLLVFHSDVTVYNTRYIRGPAEAERFVHTYLWDKERDDFRPLKTFYPPKKTDIAGALDAIRTLFNRQNELGVYVDSRVVAFMADGWQHPAMPDRDVQAARQGLETAFGASVHTIAVGRLETKLYGHSDRFGLDQEASLRAYLVTPRGLEYEKEGLKLPVPRGSFRRSPDFQGLKNHVGAIIGLNRY